MTFYSGDNLIICDRCGRKVKKSEAFKTWDNLIVCASDFEPRHPQDYLVRGRADKQAVANARPRPEDVFGTGSADSL